jgi:hypothetical protein
LAKVLLVTAIVPWVVAGCAAPGYHYEVGDFFHQTPNPAPVAAWSGTSPAPSKAPMPRLPPEQITPSCDRYADATFRARSEYFVWVGRGVANDEANILAKQQLLAKGDTQAADAIDTMTLSPNTLDPVTARIIALKNCLLSAEVEAPTDHLYVPK